MKNIMLLKKEVCVSCERFDKPKRLEDSMVRLLDDFVENGNDSEKLCVVVPNHCATSCEGRLPVLIGQRGLDVQLKVRYGEMIAGAYDISDYCRNS